MTAQIHVAVIGGGAAGTSITLALIEQGARLTLLDADALGSRSSGRSVGAVGTQMTDPFQIELRRHSIARVRDWEGRGLRFNHIGYLRLARTEAQMEALERLQRMQAEGGVRGAALPAVPTARGGAASVHRGAGRRDIQAERRVPGSL